MGVVHTGVDDGDGDVLTGLAGLYPGVEGLGGDSSTAVGAFLGDDAGDANNVATLGQRTELFGVTAQSGSSQDVVGGVDDLCISLGSDLLGLGFYTLGDSFNLGLGLNRAAFARKDTAGLGAFVSAISSELNEDLNCAFSLCQGAPNFAGGIIGLS